MYTGRMEVFITIGAPASGKSTWAREKFEEHEIVSSDEARRLICGDETNQSVTGEAWRVVHALVAAKLRSRQPKICIDATSAKKRDRVGLINFIRTHMPEGTKITGVLFAPDKKVLLERNKNRDRQVPERVIDSMLQALKSAPPAVSDGFDELKEIYQHKGRTEEYQLR